MIRLVRVRERAPAFAAATGPWTLRRAWGMAVEHLKGRVCTGFERFA